MVFQQRCEPDIVGIGPTLSMTASTKEARISETPVTTWVKPTDTHGQTIDLSIVDQVIVRCWSSYVLCFKMPDGTTSQELFDLLCKGLQNTIDQFPFIAGSLISKTDADAKNGSLEIRISPSSAVQFDYKDVSRTCGVTFEDLTREEFAPSIIQSEELQIAPSSTKIDAAPHSPVFVAQATFIPGGVILFFAHSHQITDVTGTNAIMKCWSENLTAAAEGDTPKVSESLRRASIQADRRRVSDTPSIHTVSPQPCFPMIIEDTPPPSPRQVPTNAQQQQNPSLIWHAGADKLLKLKELAKPVQEKTPTSRLSMP